MYTSVVLVVSRPNSLLVCVYIRQLKLHGLYILGLGVVHLNQSINKLAFWVTCHQVSTYCLYLAGMHVLRS